MLLLLVQGLYLEIHWARKSGKRVLSLPVMALERKFWLLTNSDTLNPVFNKGDSHSILIYDDPTEVNGIYNPEKDVLSTFRSH